LEEVEIEAGRATIGEPDDPLADHPWVAALEADPFTPPSAEGVDRTEIRELVRRGTVVEQDGVFFAQASLLKAGKLLAERFQTQPDGLTVAEVRDLLGTTRKFVLPLLNHFDQTGQTRRREDLPIAGPRLPTPG
jgi:selenocysteine-specific elongation factor